MPAAELTKSLICATLYCVLTVILLMAGHKGSGYIVLAVALAIGLHTLGNVICADLNRLCEAMCAYEQSKRDHHG